MKSTALLLLFISAFLAMICIAHLKGGVPAGVAETKDPAVQPAKPLRIQVNKIDRSSVPIRMVKQAITLYPAALECAPALPEPPVRHSRIQRDPF